MSLVCVKRLPPPLAKAIKKRRRSGRRSGEPRAGGSQMVTQFSRNIRAKISTAARPLRPSALRLPTRCHRPKKRLLASVGSLGWPCKRGRRRRRRRPAGGHSINDNLLASSSHCQLALNYDIIDPNLTSGGGGGGNGLTTAGGERRVCLFSLPARARPSGQVFFGPSPSSVVVVVVGSIIIIIYPHSLCIGTTPDR